MSTNKNKVLKSIIPAMHLGFRYFKDPIEVDTESIKLAKNAYIDKKYSNPELFPLEELVSLLKYYKEHNKEFSGPLMMITSGNAKGKHTKNRKKTGEETLGIHIVGINDGIAESMMIQAITMILNEDARKNVLLKINNIGGKPSQTEFNKEAKAYYRKHISDISADERQAFKKSIFDLYVSRNLNSDSAEIHENAPEPMDFLGEETRTHFSEMLEFIEFFNLPYEIDHNLLGDKNYSSHTVFKFIDSKSQETLALGTRYNLLAKKAGLKKDIAAISCKVTVKDKNLVSEKNLEKFNNSKFFLIQVGKQAKIMSLNLLKELAENDIYAKSSIYKDKISSQLQQAEKSKCDYFLIIGHKEALDSTVIIRDRNGRSQKIVKLNEIIKYIKNLK